jgi:ribonuclease-3
LGDAVLELITTEYLYFHFPEAQEGQMTNYRSALVRGAHLAKVARGLGFGAYLVMSSGERKSGGADKDYLLANSMESFIGAVYLSQGMDTTRKFIADFIIVNLDDIIASGEYIDSKSEFQEVAQAKFGVTPKYEVLRTEGKDHDRTFTVGAFLGDRQVGEGQGSSKKIAQTAAAQNALQNQNLWKA